MDEKTTWKLLHSHLKGEVDESLLEFVAENAHVILFWSMDLFCRRAGVDEDEVYALLNAFGVESLSEFKRLLRSILYCESHEHGTAKRPLSSIVMEMTNNERENINDIVQDMDYEKIDRLTQDILNASEVIFLCRGVAAPYAIYFTQMLTKLGIRATIINTMHELLTRLSDQDRSVLVISIGIARYSKDAIVQLNKLRQWGYRIVSITDRHDSPYIDLSDYYFFIPVRCFDFVDSYVAGMILINTILLNIGLADETKLISRLSTYDDLSEDIGIFF